MTTKTETNSTPRQSWKSYALTLENRLAHQEDEITVQGWLQPAG
jgi:hypothetical protein